MFSIAQFRETFKMLQTTEGSQQACAFAENKLIDLQNECLVLNLAKGYLRGIVVDTSNLCCTLEVTTASDDDFKTLKLHIYGANYAFGGSFSLQKDDLCDLMVVEQDGSAHIKWNLTNMNYFALTWKIIGDDDAEARKKIEDVKQKIKDFQELHFLVIPEIMMLITNTKYHIVKDIYAARKSIEYLTPVYSVLELARTRVAKKTPVQHLLAECSCTLAALHLKLITDVSDSADTTAIHVVRFKYYINYVLAMVHSAYNDAKYSEVIKYLTLLHSVLKQAETEEKRVSLVLDVERFQCYIYFVLIIGCQSYNYDEYNKVVAKCCKAMDKCFEAIKPSASWYNSKQEGKAIEIISLLAQCRSMLCTMYCQLDDDINAVPRSDNNPLQHPQCHGDLTLADTDAQKSIEKFMSHIEYNAAKYFMLEALCMLQDSPFGDLEDQVLEKLYNGLKELFQLAKRMITVSDMKHDAFYSNWHALLMHLKKEVYALFSEMRNRDDVNNVSYTTTSKKTDEPQEKDEKQVSLLKGESEKRVTADVDTECARSVVVDEQKIHKRRPSRKNRQSAVRQLSTVDIVQAINEIQIADRDMIGINDNNNPTENTQSSCDISATAANNNHSITAQLCDASASKTNVNQYTRTLQPTNT